MNREVDGLFKERAGTILLVAELPLDDATNCERFRRHPHELSEFSRRFEIGELGIPSTALLFLRTDRADWAGRCDRLAGFENELGRLRADVSFEVARIEYVVRCDFRGEDEFDCFARN